MQAVDLRVYIVHYWYMAKGKLRPAHRNSLEHQMNCVDMRKLDGSVYFFYLILLRIYKNKF